jgi:hypothetical protein
MKHAEQPAHVVLDCGHLTERIEDRAVKEDQEPQRAEFGAASVVRRLWLGWAVSGSAWPGCQLVIGGSLACLRWPGARGESHSYRALSCWVVPAAHPAGCLKSLLLVTAILRPSCDQWPADRGSRLGPVLAGRVVVSASRLSFSPRPTLNRCAWEGSGETQRLSVRVASPLSGWELYNALSARSMCPVVVRPGISGKVCSATAENDDY